MVEKGKHAPVSEQDLLMEALRFTAEDLEANRAGRLGPGNVARLNGSRLTNVWLAVISGIVCGVLGLVGLAANSISTVCLAQAGFFVVFSLGVLIYNWWKARKLAGDLNRGQVEAIQGIVTLVAASTGRSSIYRLGIGDEQFTVKAKVYNAFKNRDPYVIYYVPSSRNLVSAEPLIIED